MALTKANDTKHVEYHDATDILEKKTYFCVLGIFLVLSSPEHEVLMVSYCGQWLSVVRRRASCVVRRPSCVNI